MQVQSNSLTLKAVLLILALSLPVLAGCASTSSPSDFEGTNVKLGTLPTVDAATILSLENNDVFKVGDRAEITIFNVEDLSGTFLVNKSGNVVLPLVGEIKAAGLSTEDLQSKLVQAYGETYLQNPSINVDLDPVDLGRVVVDGAVKKPGAFDIQKIIGLSEAIAMAEGVTEDANRREVYIVRHAGGEKYLQIADLTQIRKALVDDPKLIPGDIVFVQDSTGRIIFREFLRTVPIINSILIYGTR